jgi:hypothetical protein
MSQEKEPFKVNGNQNPISISPLVPSCFSIEIHYFPQWLRLPHAKGNSISHVTKIYLPNKGFT